MERGSHAPRRMLEQQQWGEFWGGRAPLNMSYLRSNFPCREACPVRTNAGGYVSLIAQGRHEEAYALARAPNPFASVCGRVCAHPCEAACRRGAIDDPISIRALKRVVCEPLGVESNRPFEEILKIVERPRPAVTNGKRVAIIGAGPASLSCAHDLALMGHKATVFEKARFTGGMLRAGIPEYRLPREVIDAEIAFIEYLGVEIRLGVGVGSGEGEVSFAEVARDFDAVFIGAGCSRGRTVPIPGVDSKGVLTAVDFLANVNLGVPIEVGQRVVVVGGGSVAFDVARSARLFGGTSLPDEEHHNLAFDAAVAASRLLRRQVTLVALESREEMPAEPREIEEGSEEGIELINRRGPKAILSDGQGAVRALQTLQVTRVFDENGRFAPQMAPGSEAEIPCDTVVLAVGQIANLTFLGEGHGLDITPRSTILVDRATLATTRPGIYAGGDVAFGPRIIIEAVGDGRRAAKAIDTYLTGRTDPAPRYRVRVFDTFGYDHPFARGDYDKVPRMPLPLIPVEVRGLRRELERVLDEAEAGAEGERCLHCWVNTIFDSSVMQGSECIQCGGCVDVCPEQCIDLISLVRIAASSDSGSSEAGSGEPGALLLPDGARLEWLEQGASLIKDETACIRCGLCARRCPAGTITMQAFYPEAEVDLMRHAEGTL